MRSKKALLFLIIALAAFLRLWRITEIPAINADEAALGYNAYSLINTGADEHGNPWPVHFQSFNDFKPGLYVYVILPFVKVLGLNALAVRLPAVLFSVATVYLVYLLVEELFKDSRSVALPSALFLAISPWHIHFSRGGWEVTVATFFIVAGVLCFIKSVKKPSYLTVSLGSFVLSLYAYHAARIISPLLFLVLSVTYFKFIKGNLKHYFIAGVLALVLALPLGFDLLTGDVLTRASGVGLFADKGPVSRVEEQRGHHENIDSPTAILLHNKAVNYGLALAENWTDHFWGEFLFLSGDDIQRNKVPETGQMYLHDIFFVAIGLYFIVKNLDKKGWQIVGAWLLIAPLAASMTFQSPHALRAQNMVIPLTIISAYGLFMIINITKVKISKRIMVAAIYTILATVVAWGFARYLLMYFGHMTQEYPFSSQYGVEELVQFAEENKEEYDRIIVTDRYDQPYILFLYYLEYPPQEFQQEHELTRPDEFGFSTVRSFGNYRFHSIKFEEDRANYPNSLIAGTDEEIPEEANIIKEIYFPNGDIAFQVVGN